MFYEILAILSLIPFESHEEVYTDVVCQMQLFGWRKKWGVGCVWVKPDENYE